MTQYDTAGRLITPLRRATARKNIIKARHKWMAMSHKARERVMPSHRFPNWTEEQIKEELKKEHKRYIPIGGYLTKGIGKANLNHEHHHYIVTRKQKYGWTKPKIVTHQTLVKKIGKARKVWMHETPRMRARKGKAGYHKVPIIEHKHGHIVHSHEWEKIR